MVHLLLALVAALLLASPAVGSRPELEGVVRVPCESLLILMQAMARC